MSSPIKWSGRHMFYITGIGNDDDTIRIVGDQRKIEKLLTLVLPTLCITYADMQFANQIGGVQKKYPDSKEYGPQFFEPPVVISNPKEIEKFTLIRGAKQVTIGQEETKIEFESYRTLIVPQLQIKKKERATAVVNVPEIEIIVTQPFNAKIMQFADGRHIGGVQFTKAHPDWKPKPIPERYDLWVRVIDDETRRALAETKVTLSDWDPNTGNFVEEAVWYTNKMGIAEASNLPCSDKKLLTIEHPPWLSQTLRFHPLPGQKVKRTFKLWQNSEVTFPYIVLTDVTVSIQTVAGLSRKPTATILEMNRVGSLNELKSGQTINIPCYTPTYRVQARDTLEKLAARFCYNNVEELARANKLSKPYKIYRGQQLRLTGWHFFMARVDDQFDKLDEQFSLPKGWIRPVKKVHHDVPNRIHKNELIAIPSQEFIKKHKLRRRFRIDSDQP